MRPRTVLPSVLSTADGSLIAGLAFIKKDFAMKTYAYAATAVDKPLAPFSFDRRAPCENDVVLKILFCGVCHSDLHTARNDWGWTNYPIVVGHEIVGRVIEVGPGVTRH